MAEAALSGDLSRAHLRSLPPEQALEEIRRIDGIGPFFASGVLNRGAGVVDDITDDDLTKYAVQVAYELSERPSQVDTLRIAESWGPFRMWAEVLLHVWLRREVGYPGVRAGGADEPFRREARCRGPPPGGPPGGRACTICRLRTSAKAVIAPTAATMAEARKIVDRPAL